MAQTIAEALMQQGEERAQLRSARKAVQDVLEERFGSVPEEVKQRIAAATDLERLWKAHRQAVKIDAPDSIEL